MSRRIGRALMRGPRRRWLYNRLNTIGKRTLGPRVRSGPAAGLRFDGGDTIGYVLGVSEPLVQRALTEHLSEGSVFYDVGAHAGFTSVLGCRLVGSAGEVHCFEPVPANVSVLRRNLDGNSFANATVHSIALSDMDGTAAMAAETGHITAHLSGHGELTVRTARLDSLALRPPDVIKIDVEGAEAAVLAGMMDTIRLHRPILIIEIHGDQDQPVRQALAQAEYSRIEQLADGGMPHLLARP